MADISSIVAELKQERDRINAAITALEGDHGPGNSRKPGPNGRKVRKARRGRRKLSAAAKRRLSEAAKARWAKAKKAGRNAL
jgi:hypothetical protein